MPLVQVGSDVQYRFVQWTYGNETSYNIEAPIEATTISANYDTWYNLTIQDCKNGEIAPSKSGWYISGDTVKFLSTPQSGYTLKNWVLDGKVDATTNEFSVVMDKPHSIYAVFTQTPTENALSYAVPVIVAACVIAVIFVLSLYLYKRKHS